MSPSDATVAEWMFGLGLGAAVLVALWMMARCARALLIAVLGLVKEKRSGHW